VGSQDAFVFKAWDGDLASAGSVTVKLTLAAANDAPRMDISGNAVLTTVLQNSPNNGTSVIR
jgi:hypothetical protein